MMRFVATVLAALLVASTCVPAHAYALTNSGVDSGDDGFGQYEEDEGSSEGGSDELDPAEDSSQLDDQSSQADQALQDEDQVAPQGDLLASDELGDSEADGASEEGSSDEGETPDIASVGLSVTAHVQDIGWMPEGCGAVGETIAVGTTGLSKQVEALTLSVDVTDLEISGALEYRVHVQDYGWQDWVTGGEVAGTTGKSKQVEALQIRLTGDLASYCDVFYRVHVQDYGWLGWAKNSGLSGSVGLSKQVEALEIVLLPAGSGDPGATDYPYYDAQILEQIRMASALVEYRTHVQDFGWQSLKIDGNISGTSGQSKRLEGIEISLGSGALSAAYGGVSYCTHVQDYGWQDWVSDGSLSGTTGQSKRLEAIRIELTGEIANLYDVYYRVHSQNFGWMGWAKNGESAGTAGFSYRLEAIQIELAEKGSSAPGSTTFAFCEKGGMTGTAAEFVAVALAEPDGRPDGGDSNKYTGYHYDPWCAYFVSWCARQAGVSAAVIPELYYCPYLKSYYQTKGQWRNYRYMPKTGDLIFYSTRSGGSPTHVGIVTSCSNGVIHTKEGNVGDGVVGSRTRIVGSSYVAGGWYIVGYATPF